MSRTRKALVNIITSALLEIITMISGIILPRFILQYFGSSYNGIVSSSTQFLGMIQVLTLGVTASTRVALYKSLAKKDTQQSSAIIRATERYMRKIALILGGYIIALSFVYPLVVHTDFSYFDVAILIAIVGMSSFAEYFFGITYQTFLLADQSVYISNIFSSIATILNIIISIFLITSGFNIQIVKLGSAVVYVLRPLLQNIYVTRKYKLDKHCVPDMTALNKRGDAMVHALANIVHDNTDIIVLTIFTDIKIVSVYTVYNMVMSALKKIQTVFTKGTEPIFGSMWAGGEKEKIKRYLSVYEFVVNSFNAAAFGVAMVMVLSFVSLYIPGNITDVNYIRPTYAILISLAFATQGIRVPYLALVQGIGHYKETRNAAIIEATLNLGISVVLVNIIGMEGVAIGTLVANLYRTISYALYIDKNVVKRGKSIVFKKIIWTLLVMMVIVLPSFIIVNKLEIINWIQWVGTSVLVCVFASLVVFIASVMFYKEDLKYSIRVIKAMIKKRS